MSAASFALDWQDYSDGEHRLTCPYCGRSPKDKTAGLKVDGDKAVLHCFRCDATETYRAKQNIIRRAPSVKAPLQQEKRTTLSEWGRALWDSTQELSGVAVAYLEHRHCVIPPAYGDLRWHPALKHMSGHVGPALVALITDIDTNAPLSLHRTWIYDTGKADVDPPRYPLKGHATTNGVIKLWPAEDVCDKLGIAEGIESALSLAHCVPFVWSCIDAGHLGQFPVLAGITELAIAQDKDTAGIRATTATTKRWTDSGRIVWITNQQKNDINDVVEAA